MGTCAQTVPLILGPNVGKGGIMRRFLHRALLFLLVATAAATARAAEPMVGAIVGIVENAARTPIPHATVTAMRTDGTAIRATVAGTDGVFTFGDLPPGEWTITA